MDALKIARDSYGMLVNFAQPGTAQEDMLARQQLLDAARKMVATAASRGKLLNAYDNLSWDRRGRADGDALHHEIYDVSPTGRRVLVCVRTSEGSKYGVRTTSKNYFVVAAHGAGLRVLAANKSVAAKAAKSAGGTLGIVIDTALGKCKLTLKAGAVRTGYKILVRAGENFRSAWDNSEWQIGRARVEAATDDHSGGYYYYASVDECLAAAANNEVFGRHRDASRLAIVEVEASGRHYAHEGEHGKKLCATRVKILREIGSTL